MWIIAAAFAGGVIGTALTLVVIGLAVQNIMGQR